MDAFNPDYAIPPAETLEELLEDRELSLTMFAERSGIPMETLERIMRAETQIDSDLAVKLEKATGVVASFWLNMEKNYRLRSKEGKR